MLRAQWGEGSNPSARNSTSSFNISDDQLFNYTSTVKRTQTEVSAGRLDVLINRAHLRRVGRCFTGIPSFLSLQQSPDRSVKYPSVPPIVTAGDCQCIACMSGERLGDGLSRFSFSPQVSSRRQALFLVSSRIPGRPSLRHKIFSPWTWKRFST